MSGLSLRRRAATAVAALVCAGAGALAPVVHAAGFAPVDIRARLENRAAFAPHVMSIKGSQDRAAAAYVTYHGGPVMLGTVNMYYIWYGNWAGGTTQQILTDFANTIGGSNYYNINTTYYDGNGSHVYNGVTYGGSCNDNYSFGTVLTADAVWFIVANAVNAHLLPYDVNGVYFVMASVDVDESDGLCTSYCGWHTHRTLNNQELKYSFIGDGDRCPNVCEQQTASSPNNNVGADAMVNIVAHELDETVTDPNQNAWYGDNGSQENGDNCVWQFASIYTAPNGSQANMRLGARDYLIQENFNATTQTCQQFSPFCGTNPPQKVYVDSHGSLSFQWGNCTNPFVRVGNGSTLVMGGGTLSIAAGNYNESVSLGHGNKPITVTTTGGTVTIGR